MELIQSLFRESALLSLFFVIGLGTIIGRVKIKGVNLGIAVVLFVGVFLASWIPDIEVPEFAHSFGLVLFIYSIGLYAGPSFFNNEPCLKSYFCKT